MEAKIINQWNKGLRIKSIANSRAASYFRSKDRFWGRGSTILTTIVATGVFATLTQKDVDWLFYLTGTVSTFAAVVNGMYSRMNYGKLSESHANAGRSYSSIRKELEATFLTSVEYTPEVLQHKMLVFQEKIADLEHGLPPVPQHIFDKAKRIVSAEYEAQLMNKLK